MNKITKILIGSNNKGKFKEISDLLPNSLEKVSPKIPEINKININIFLNIIIDPFKYFKNMINKQHMKKAKEH